MKTIKASVVIPLKNGGALFRRVLDAVLMQETTWSFEILVIDSGSSDRSDIYCLNKPNVRLYRVKPEDFGHGRTRNLGAKLTTGEFIVMLTHDALPADNLWLQNLVEACDQQSDIAGAFGRHLPYPEAMPILSRDLNRHFDFFNSMEPIVRMEDSDRYACDESYRQFLHFFSDNNSCLRRSVWENYHYPDVDFAEDQIWAKKIIEAGYAKAYSNNACVYHSHNYKTIELFRRSLDESYALNSLFGYKLCPKFYDVLLRSWVRSWEDISYVRSEGSSHNSIISMAELFLRNFLRCYGHYLGSADWFPNSLRKIISLDQSLLRS